MFCCFYSEKLLRQISVKHLNLRHLELGLSRPSLLLALIDLALAHILIHRLYDN